MLTCCAASSVGPRRVGPRRVGLVERDRVGQDEKRLVAREQELGFVSLGPNWHF